MAFPAMSISRSRLPLRLLSLLVCPLPVTGAGLSDLERWAIGQPDRPAASDCEPVWSGLDHRSGRSLSACVGEEAGRGRQATAPSPDGARTLPPADVSSGGLAPKARIGAEDREPTDVDRYPFSAVGRVEFSVDRARGLTSTCTGALLGPRIVLTNGHCVWDRQTDKWYEDVAFVPGLDGTEAPYGRYKAREAWISRGYQEGQGGLDYAFLILDTPAGRRTGWLGATEIEPRWLDQPFWTVAGYPSNYTDNPFRADLQVAHFGCSIRSIGNWTDQGPLFHDCDTGQGASGSPIFGFLGGQPYVIGVNYGGWGPRDRQRMESCSPPSIGTCMNLAASARSWLPLLKRLMHQYPD